MKVDVALFAHLSSLQPDGRGGRRARSFDLPDGATVRTVIDLLGLPEEPRILLLDGRHAKEDTHLTDGARLAIFPPVAGG